MAWESRDSGQKLFHGDYFEVVHVNLMGTESWSMGGHQGRKLEWDILVKCPSVLQRVWINFRKELVHISTLFRYFTCEKLVKGHIVGGEFRAHHTVRGKPHPYDPVSISPIALCTGFLFALRCS